MINLEITRAEYREAKNYIQSLKDCDAAARAALAAYDKARKDATSLTAVTWGDKVSNTSQRDLSDVIVRLEKQLEEMNHKWDSYIDRRVECLNYIGQMADAKEQSVLIYRYILCKSWPEVAKEMHYTREHLIREIHSRALQSFAKVFVRARK